MGNKCKVISIENEDDGVIRFDNGMSLNTYHPQDCCESHYWSLEDLTMSDFEGLEFDLSNSNFFERLDGYGIALNPISGFPIRIPAYGFNNGYYSSYLSLELKENNKLIIAFDISECQDYEID